MKIIVTHKNPDLDAACGIWLIRRFLVGWAEADVKFVPAGETLEKKNPDNNPQIIHVDTGMGKFDHHQSNEITSSSRLCLDYILEQKEFKQIEQKTLRRMIEVVTEIDNGRDVGWPEAENDRYEFMLHNFICNIPKDESYLNFVALVMDTVFKTFKDKVKAEEVMEKRGIVFETPWGEAIAVETSNDYVLYIGEKKGYALVVKQDPKNNHLRIYGRYDKKIDLTPAYKKFKKKDSKATWYLHPSKCLLLNGQRANPEMVTTKLTLEQVIKVLKKGK